MCGFGDNTILYRTERIPGDGEGRGDLQRRGTGYDPGGLSLMDISVWGGKKLKLQMFSGLYARSPQTMYRKIFSSIDNPHACGEVQEQLNFDHYLFF